MNTFTTTRFPRKRVAASVLLALALAACSGEKPETMLASARDYMAKDDYKSAVIQVKKEWPTWRPTDEMIERDPGHYGKFKDNDYVQPGGPGNPLGARALYLFQNGRDTYFRIHGTTEPSSIGRSVSNGCIRMINEHVMDLYQRVPIGTKVTVV